jgi:hypothetical protein
LRGGCLFGFCREREEERRKLLFSFLFFSYIVWIHLTCYFTRQVPSLDGLPCLLSLSDWTLALFLLLLFL